MRRCFHLVLFFFSAVFACLAFQLDFITSEGRPGAGFLPILVGVGLVVLTGLSLREVYGKSGKKAERREQGVYPKDMVAVILLTSLLVLLFRTLGSLPATALYIFSVCLYFNRQKMVQNVLLSLIVPILIYLLLQVWLNAGLPKGVLEWI